MNVMYTPSPPPSTAKSERWSSRRHLAHWLHAFSTYFPTKAHLADRVAARLGGCEDSNQLKALLTRYTQPNEVVERGDMLYAKRRMVFFKEDRLILINEFGLLPDAADLFLTACPVGCGQCFIDPRNPSPFERGLSYYGDVQIPSDRLLQIVDQQRQEALGQLLSNVDSTKRLGEYLHPNMLVNLFLFLRWDAALDTDGQDNLGAVPATRVAWVADSELGKIEIFSLRFTPAPVWARDEVFWSVLMELRRTRDLTDKPVVLLNNRPMQLIRGGQTYTSIGWMVVESKAMPLLVSHHGHSLGNLLIDLVTFDAASSVALTDENNVALSVFWNLLRTTSNGPLPSSPSFRSMPDGWMINAT